MTERITLTSGDHSYEGHITNGGVVFTPVQRNSIEGKFLDKVVKALSDIQFSGVVLAQMITYHMPPILQKKFFYLCREYIGILADRWDTETYDNELSEEAYDAGIMRQALKDQDRWEL